MLDLVEMAFTAKGITYCRIDGTQSPQEKDNQVAQFQADGSKRVMLVSLLAGGVGYENNEIIPHTRRVLNVNRCESQVDSHMCLTRTFTRTALESDGGGTSSGSHSPDGSNKTCKDFPIYRCTLI